MRPRPPSIQAFEIAVTDGTFRADPFPWFDLLREQAPVYYSETLGQWWVTTYELVEEVLLSTDKFTSHGFDSGFIGRLDQDTLDDVPMLTHHFQQRGLIQSDPPEHTRMRKAVRADFTVQAANRLAGAIQGIVDRLLEPIDDDLELVRDLAGPLPVEVIAELLGVPEEDRGNFPRWSMETVDFFGASSGPDPALARQLDRSLVEWREMLRRLLEERARDPQDDFLSHAAAMVAEGRLTSEEAIFTGVHLLLAGHETTTGLIASVFYHLLSRPQLQEEVVADLDLVPALIEETLRFDPPVQRAKRVTTTDIDFHGNDIAAGELVGAMISAAGRDATRFPDPDRFDIHRAASRNPHFAFGRGVHLCLGASLARLETEIAIRSILARFPEATFREGFQPQWVPPINFHKLVEVSVRTGGRVLALESVDVA